MLIKFKKPDPRAGMTARMDSSRGQQLIDAGAADQLSESVDLEQASAVSQPPDGGHAKTDGVAIQASVVVAKPARGKK